MRTVCGNGVDLLLDRSASDVRRRMSTQMVNLSRAEQGQIDSLPAEAS